MVIPVGRIPTDLVDELCAISETYGTGEIRLTVWQNLLIPNIPDENLEAAKAALIAAGCHFNSTSISGGLIACTGNTGCKYAATNTKGNSVDLARYLESKVQLDQPINIHLTGCNHSCAQHYIGDIGMMGVQVKTESGDKVDGYNIVLGGGVDDDQFVAIEAFKGIPYSDVPVLIETLLKTYLGHRESGETFAHFTRRVPIDEIKGFMATDSEPIAA